ncbi:MAG: NUDIX hydrolase [Firmicutes bacterium]|nr:NUDIX hydrolase [Bacillota bacterium]MTI70933.1 NUDIX hydrolase [Bacillota bacterium]
MLFRNCAGGVVFKDQKVFILKNEKDEWVLPKGRIRNGELAAETAVKRVNEETDLTVEIVSTAGETNYEFYSFSRQRPVTNEIIWYLMEAKDEEFEVNKEEGFKDGGFYDIEKAIEMITYSQDKSLVSLSYKKYLAIKKDLEIA